MWRVEAFEDVYLVEAFDGYQSREDAEAAILELEAEDNWIGYGYTYTLVPPSKEWITSFVSDSDFVHIGGDAEYDEL